MAEPAGAPLIPLLYSDKYVDVYETKVVVKGLYFPWGSIGHKNIQMEDIESVDSGSDLRLKWWQVKGWGMAFTRRYRNVVFVCGFLSANMKVQVTGSRRSLAASP
jgi:hypothetical protein